MPQLLLFPDPRPLVERLGAGFFQQAPKQPGVYLMRDAADEVLYVGKAKNLKHRLASYRVANPDRLPRRQLRMLRQVARIELRECADEPSALATESDLLRRLRPRFNRAGTWPASRRYLLWRVSQEGLELALSAEQQTLETGDPGSAGILPAGFLQNGPEEFAASPQPSRPKEEREICTDPGWYRYGPLGSSAFHLRSALARLLWGVLQPQRGLAGIPGGWFVGRLSPHLLVITSDRTAKAACPECCERLCALFAGQTDQFTQWIRDQTPKDASLFELAARDADLETLTTILG